MTTTKTGSQEEVSARSNALRLAGIAAKQASAAQTEWTQRRDQAILFAHQQGASLRDIGEAIGLSHVGVKKILERITAAEILQATEPTRLRSQTQSQ